MASFLAGRRMTVRIGQKQSSLRSVNAGAPQGSVLGCYLFTNVGIDDLEEDFDCPEAAQENTFEETLGPTGNQPTTSTPTRARLPPTVAASPVIGRRRALSFTILPRVANVPPWIQKPKDPTYHEGQINSYKFVDDSLNTSVVNMRKAQLLEQDGVLFKDLRDLRTQRLLQHVAQRADERGMKINATKTSLMCVSAATSFEPRVKITLDGRDVHGAKSLKVLGVTIDSDMTFRSHIEKLAAKARARTWALSKLRKKGLGAEKLVRVYCGLIRPVLEYCAPAWHSLLTAGQSESLERQQSQALKNIYGTGMSAAKLRTRAGIETLNKRRMKMSLKFAKKCLTNPRCQSWFQERGNPTYQRRSSVNYRKYREPIARTDRFRNSPKNFLIRLLNSET